MKLVGEKRLIRLLERSAPKAAKKAIRKGSRDGSKIITRAAKANAPEKSGRLGRAIKTRAAKRRRGFIGTVTRIGAGAFLDETFYGGFQEWGWKTGKRGSENRRQIPGKHFLEEAAKQKGPQAGHKAVSTTKRVLLQEVKR